MFCQDWWQILFLFSPLIFVFNFLINFKITFSTRFVLEDKVILEYSCLQIRFLSPWLTPYGHEDLFILLSANGCFCQHGYLCTMCMSCACGGQKSVGSSGTGVTDKLCAIVMWRLGIQPGSSARAASALNWWAILSAPNNFSFNPITFKANYTLFVSLNKLSFFS